MEFIEDRTLQGKVRIAGDDGLPAWGDIPPPTHDELIDAAEQVRQQLLVHADATMLDWRTELMLGEISDANREKLSAWLAFKNDVKSTNVTIDPEHVIWPAFPEE
ncbi:tail fiber assembly protein [Escherichia coli]|nr:tail fiber assembly protein [Escherichia coli]